MREMGSASGAITRDPEPLSPCPACLQEDAEMGMVRTRDHGDMWQVRCLACGLAGPAGHSLAMARVLWNGSWVRAPRPPSPSQAPPHLHASTTEGAPPEPYGMAYFGVWPRIPEGPISRKKGTEASGEPLGGPYVVVQYAPWGDVEAISPIFGTRAEAEIYQKEMDEEYPNCKHRLFRAI